MNQFEMEPGMMREKTKRRLFYFMEIVVLVLLDQGTKALAVARLKGQAEFSVLPGIFELTYLENRGAAWGILQNAQPLFLLITGVMLAALFLGVRRLPVDRSWMLCRLLCAMMAAGAIGNGIDRLFRGYVIDFFYLSCIDFPVFNVADCYVTVSIVLFLLIYRKEVLRWMQE